LLVFIATYISASAGSPYIGGTALSRLHYS